MKKSLLTSLLWMLACPVWAGVNTLDPSGNPAWTDVVQQGQGLASVGAENNAPLRGQATCAVDVRAIVGATLQFEGTIDNANYIAANCTVPGTGATVTSTTTNGSWICATPSYFKFRVRQSAGTSATVSVVCSQGTSTLYNIVQGAVTTAAPTYITGTTSPLSLTTGGSMRTDWSSQGATAITSVPVAAGSGTLTGNAPVVNAAMYVGTATAVASSAGVQKVGIAGGAAGAAIDAANNAAAPANLIVTGLQLRDGTTATAGTVGQVGSPAGSLDHVQYYRYGGPVPLNCLNENITAQANCPAAASGAGLFYYLSTLVISNEAATANSFDVVSSVNTGCTTPVALTHKFAGGTLATTTSPFLINVRFDPPIKCNAANCFICVRPTAATAYGVTMTGYIAP